MQYYGTVRTTFFYFDLLLMCSLWTMYDEVTHSGCKRNESKYRIFFITWVPPLILVAIYELYERYIIRISMVLILFIVIYLILLRYYDDSKSNCNISCIEECNKVINERWIDTWLMFLVVMYATVCFVAFILVTATNIAESRGTFCIISVSLQSLYGVIYALIMMKIIKDIKSLDLKESN